MIPRRTLVLGVAVLSSACVPLWQSTATFHLAAPVSNSCARAVVRGGQVAPPDLRGGNEPRFALVIEEGTGVWEVEQRPRADSTVELSVTYVAIGSPINLDSLRLATNRRFESLPAALSDQCGAHSATQVASHGFWLSGGRLLCGYDYTRSPRIDVGRVGPLSLGADRAQLRRLCPEARDTAVDRYVGFRILAFGGLIEVLSDSLGGSVDAIRILGGSLRAADGIGVGTSVKELQRVWGSLRVNDCEGVAHGASAPTHPGIYVLFRPENLCSHPSVAAVYSDTLRIAGFELR